MPKASIAGRFSTGVSARVEETASEPAAEAHVDIKVDEQVGSEGPQCSPASSEPVAWKGHAANRGPADEKRRRWADIADDDDEEEDDACSSHPSESTRGSLGFSDYASTHGSTKGDCTDSEYSDVDA